MINISIQARRTKEGVRIKLDTGETIIGKYYLYARINGKRVKVGVGGHLSVGSAKDEAHDIQQEYKENSGLGTYRNITLKQVCDKYYKSCESNNDAPSTLAMKKRYMLQLCNHRDEFKAELGDKAILKITIDDIDEFKNAQSKIHKSPNGLAIVFRTINPAFCFAIKRGWLKGNVCAESASKINEEDVAHFLTLDETTALKQACRFNSELFNIVQVALHTGMRKQEILNIRAENIINNHISVPIRLSSRAKTKSRQPRLIPIHKELAFILTKSSGLIFEGWSVDRLNRAYGRAKKRSGIKVARFHDLRHTFASRYLQKGGNLPGLKKLLGQTTLAAVERYSHFEPDYLAESINRIDYTPILKVV